MATAYTILLGPNDIGNFHRGDFNPAAATKVSEVLQRNAENWDIIFSGLRHNHIVHCILTIYALGATPEEIQEVYDREASYQRPRYPVDKDFVKSFADVDQFKQHLGEQPHYSNYLLYFQREIEANGVRKTLEKHIFADTDHAHRLFALLYNGIFHPYIHLGYAFEYNQPALVAEALAMASVHDPEFEKMGPVYIQAEERALRNGKNSGKSLRELIHDVRLDNDLRTSIDGSNKIDRSKNVVTNAKLSLVEYIAQYTIADGQLQEKMYEMVDVCSLFIATKPAAIGKDQPYKADFFLLHSVNTLAMIPSLAKHPWSSHENSVRLMEWAGRCHLLNYVSQAAPPLTPAEVDSYPTTRTWQEIFDYSIHHPSDDGHLGKCVRSLAFGEKVMSGKFGTKGYEIRPDSWLKLANLITDHVPWEAHTSVERWLLSF